MYYPFNLILAAGLLLLAMTAHSTAVDENKSQHFNPDFALNIPGNCSIFSEADYWVMPNGMQVLLMSDPDAAYSRVAVDVAVGYRDDPQDIPGMAHFLEHMLFLGTERFPAADTYRTFLEQNGGSGNASTRFHSTDYRLSIETPFLERAIEIFADQFRAPLLSEHYVQKEKQAIAAEFSYRKESTYRRLYSVAKTEFFANTSYGNFGTGNAESLSKYDDATLTKRMREWWRSHYRPDRMALVIHSSLPLEQLKRLAIKNFGDLKVREPVPAQSKDSKPEKVVYAPRLAKAFINDEERAMLLLFPLRDVSDEENYAAHSFIKHLLERRLPTSYVTSLAAYDYTRDIEVSAFKTEDGQSWLQIYYDLYYKGGENYWEPIKQLFHYVDQLKKEPLEQWRLDQFNNSQAIDWCFNQDVTVSRYAQNLNFAPPRFALSRHIQAETYAPEIYQQILDDIRADNMQIVVAHPHHSGSQTSAWYDVEYEVENLDAQRLKHFKPKPEDRYYISRPEKNPYFPGQISIGAPLPSQNKPQRIQTEKGIEAWIAQDTSYQDRRAKFYVEWRSPLVEENRKSSIITDFLWSFLRDQLKHDRAMVRDARGALNISRIPGGIGFYLTGFPQSIDLMLDRVSEKLVDFKVREREFMGWKYGWTEYYKEYEDIHPQTQANEIEGQILFGKGFTYSDLQKGARSARYSNLKSLLREWRELPQVVTLGAGNVSTKQVQEWNQKIEATLVKEKPMPAAQNKELVSLSTGITRILSESNFNDSLVSMYVQGHANGFAEQARFLLLERLMSEDFFTALRTEKQQGYYIDADYHRYREMPGIRFQVQSPNAAPHQLEGDVLEFLESYEKSLRKVPAETFASIKKTLSIEMEREADDFNKHINRIWRGVSNHHAGFNYRQEIASEITGISKEDFETWFNSRFGASTRRMLSTLITSQHHELSSDWEDQTEDSFIDDFQDYISDRKESKAN